MLKRLIQTLTIILPLTLSPLAMGADYSKGVDAHEKGDYKTALAQWKPLAEQGDADVQFNLGLMYDNGKGVLQDYKLTYMWFNIARYNGASNAQKLIDMTTESLSQTHINQAQEMSSRCIASGYKNCGYK